MSYLLDTHVFLWSLNNDRRLTNSIRNILTDPSNLIYVSVVSVWEVGIKLKKNSSFSLKTSLKKTFTISGFEILPVIFEHTLEVYRVPLHRDHKDPFDRMLIAQAKFEKLTLITHDPKIWKYKISVLKA